MRGGGGGRVRQTDKETERQCQRDRYRPTDIQTGRERETGSERKKKR